jgi:hypothetical protein
MTSFFPLEIFFFLLFMGEFPVVFEQLWYRQGFPAR